MIDTILFDLDGTLTDTLEDLTDSVNFALTKNGLSPRSTGEVRSFVGNGIKKLIDLSVPQGTDEAKTAKCLEDFKSHYAVHCNDKTKPYPGIPEIIDFLSDNGYKTAVVTNKIQSSALNIVKTHFGKRIETVIGNRDNLNRKPSPDGVFLALKELNSNPENAVFVGDSDIDCITAKNAGIKCIGVTWGFRSEEVLRQSGADYIAHSAEELEKTITLN
ncbi:MAG: HAD family hydrolase [Clostridiales bacterium]|nr:HAD family hydrolase [Clostridiales bacterium]